MESSCTILIFAGKSKMDNQMSQVISKKVGFIANNLNTKRAVCKSVHRPRFPCGLKHTLKCLENILQLYSQCKISFLAGDLVRVIFSQNCKQCCDCEPLLLLSAAKKVDESATPNDCHTQKPGNCLF